MVRTRTVEEKCGDVREEVVREEFGQNDGTAVTQLAVYGEGGGEEPLRKSMARTAEFGCSTTKCLSLA